MNGFEELMKLTDLPDAIFAVNDPVAIGVFQKMKEKGMNIPGDIALVGFSDNPICALINPPLTSVAQPAYDMGMIAAELLLDQINTQPKDWRSVKRVLSTNLVIREST
jgi:DNA-binding LacI/PurR family transcriptional regulator